MKNRYFRYAKISECVFRAILRNFADDQTASQTSREVGLSPRSVNPIYQRIRKRLAEWSEAHVPTFSTLVQVNEHCFGPRNAKGPPGRGASKKLLVLGFMGQKERVYTVYIENACKATLHSAICEQVQKGTTIVTTRWRGYEGLHSVGYPDHRRVRNTHRGGYWSLSMGVNITSFWLFTHKRIARFGGVQTKNLQFHISESEFRWNHRGKDLYKLLLRLFRENPL